MNLLPVVVMESLLQMGLVLTTGWFGMVPTGNAVFNDGSLVYFYVQLNDGAGGTVMAQSIRTASTIEMIATATTARAARGLSNGTAEDMVFLYDNTAGTGRPLYGTWIESDGITPTYSLVWCRKYSESNFRNFTPIVFSVADASFANLTWYADVDGDGYGDAVLLLLDVLLQDMTIQIVKQQQSIQGNRKL
jgi:hypothetical protein